MIIVTNQYDDKKPKLNIMNGLNTTEGAPVMPVAENNAAPAAAVKTPTKRKAAARKTGAVTIARRKVLAGQHKITGAPKLPVLGLTKNPRKGPFTLKDIFSQNGDTISLLTIKKRRNELIDAGQLVIDTVAAKRQHEGHGRPPQYFNFDLTQGTVKTKKTRKGKTKPAGTAPIVAADEPMPAEQPAVAEPAVIEEQPAVPAIADGAAAA